MFLVVAFWQLGDTELPQTRWQPIQSNESFILQIADGSSAFDRIYLLSGEGDNNALESGYQIGLRNVLIEGSNDLVNWDNISQIDNSSYLQWKIIDGDVYKRQGYFIPTSIIRKRSESAWSSLSG